MFDSPEHAIKIQAASDAFSRLLGRSVEREGDPIESGLNKLFGKPVIDERTIRVGPYRAMRGHDPFEVLNNLTEAARLVPWQTRRRGRDRHPVRAQVWPQ